MLAAGKTVTHAEKHYVRQLPQLLGTQSRERGLKTDS